MLDFAPRFLQFERMFRPTNARPHRRAAQGTPRVRVRCEPRLGWSKADAAARDGSQPHRLSRASRSPLRLTTDVPLSYLDGEPFALTERKHLVAHLGRAGRGAAARRCASASCSETVALLANAGSSTATSRRSTSSEVIRSALALKLHCFEDTGAIVAAMTTSIPESPGSGRTWDYRYCWLRDAYYVLGAFRLLGHFEEREQLHQLPAQHRGRRARPRPRAALPRRRHARDLEERMLDELAGFRATARCASATAPPTHTQHDIFGEMVLALSPLFLDERFRDRAHAAGARSARAAGAQGRSRSPARPTPASGSTAPSGSRRPSRA